MYEVSFDTFASLKRLPSKKKKHAFGIMLWKMGNLHWQAMY